MQCHNFNEDWTFEKADQADRLKAFYGNSNAVAVTLPHDAMIREKRDKDCPSEWILSRRCVYIRKKIYGSI